MPYVFSIIDAKGKSGDFLIVMDYGTGYEYTYAHFSYDVHTL